MAAQKRCRSSRRPTGGRPGERSFARPDRPARRVLGVVIATSSLEVLRRPIESAQYLCIRYTERLAEAGIEPSVGSRGDSYDNALAESVIGLYKTELDPDARAVEARRGRGAGDAQLGVVVQSRAAAGAARLCTPGRV